MLSFLLLVILFIVFFAFVTHVRNSLKYWGKYGKCNPRYQLIWKNIINTIFARNNIVYRMDSIYKAYKNEKFVGFYEILRPSLLIMDPELIGDVFIKDFHYFHDRRLESAPRNRIDHHLVNLAGSKWKNVRAKLLPTFSSMKLKLMFKSIDDCAQVLSLNISETAKNKQLVNVKEEMTRFAMDVIGRCVFGLEFNAMNDPNSEFRKIGKMFFSTSSTATIKRIMRLFYPKSFFAFSSEIETFFFDLLKRTEELRKTERITRNDFIQLMFNIRDEELAKKENDELFTDEIIASNMFIFFLAGFETTASTLTFCLYELALHPDIQERLRNEIIQVRNANNGVLDFNTLAQLTYMEMIISETLRKHPIVALISRVCTEAYQIPGTSVILQPGDPVGIPTYSIHHDERYYENPEKFDPDRFTEENNARRIPNTYIPFGTGPRICIGLRFAKMEMKYCLAALMQKFKFSPCAQTDIPLVINARAGSYTTKRPIWLTVEEI